MLLRAASTRQYHVQLCPVVFQPPDPDSRVRVLVANGHCSLARMPRPLQSQVHFAQPSLLAALQPPTTRRRLRWLVERTRLVTSPLAAVARPAPRRRLRAPPVPQPQPAARRLQATVAYSMATSNVATSVRGHPRRFRPVSPSPRGRQDSRANGRPRACTPASRHVRTAAVSVNLSASKSRLPRVSGTR